MCPLVIHYVKNHQDSSQEPIIWGIIAIIIATGTATGIAYGVGAFESDEPITKEVLNIQKDVDSLQAKWEETEMESINELKYEM